ncbi:MAG: hypothetical protein A2312_00825 [Candidatus Staskawiczbacteria bacterium RIFOXYB2_FULL_32_9]|uniref:Zinc-binding domain-containing protein n=1 Tax=Candidatus Staskawiczbacteria bacterium RIFOXYD1_FULL_32_13 TaxID=1802234 RepID=A0A1G2JKN8_9BACT|nr:MAG: hypothetical protein UR22_C0001G0036 [Parcubacteria group bacterium GW2011_GWC2_32_10]OGZ79734.1 MAG: hypothetical protein A2360_04780 [Candidatus Staskawiczbacteria bacterium RIFOXYB1_FULL_32_11]OGZ84458.1 MAG: hypothetical protein A2312_00825 [Candidatus Staskawiczbacteria bacterium RIFOXYB2_FULL_32_9]OGZ87221.1 MAG: hypothetical protein A2463_03635 [Candidatus Staskawiczbacteria bacterium RIFOXYC2_FULL_32_10]OGZ87674.1 MAG: hypothetical protein A2561_03180 [Candidatus Staskawiczbacte
MNSETKNCQNCKKDFVIEPDDFAFYEKIKVPPPTFCPECRLMRRYAWRNERVLYRRNCDLCEKSTVTIYSPNKPYKVYCPSCWWSDKWSALDCKQDFDFSRPFFEQFKELQLKVPRIALLTKNSVNSEYTNHSNNNKNCYMSVTTFDSENVMYSYEIHHASQDVCDCLKIDHGSQLIYECIDSEKCYKCQYCMFLRDSTDCYYCYDCRNCQNCFLSCNLRNKQYYFLNSPNSKEEYEKKIKEYNLGLYNDRKKLYDAYLKLIKEQAIHRFAVIEKSNNVSGNLIFNSKKVNDSFEVVDMEDAKYIVVALEAKDLMDSTHFGYRCELIYETHATIHSYNMAFTHLSYDNSHLQYCDTCHNSQNLFGCVGVKSGSYCIFNKQYTKEQYDELRSKIIEHMKKTEEYGEFFPPQLSPFGYNETVGIIHIPIGKKEALSRGYKWEDLVQGTFGKETIQPEDIPNDIKNIKDTIIKEALRCINCSRNYNIVTQELQLYRRENIPIPRLCSDCRYKNRVNLRSLRKLWHRKCMKSGCSNEFETSYAPDRPEIVYCEACYNQEVA